MSMKSQTPLMSVCSTVLLLVVMFPESGIAREQTIPLAEARSYAQQWLAANPVAARYTREKGQSIDLGGMDTIRVHSTAPAFYLFQLEPQGYLVMNSDQRLPPVVCFSLTAKARLDVSAENTFRGLLTFQAQRNAQYLTVDRTSPRRLASPEPSVASRFLSAFVVQAIPGDIIGPLLETGWNQSRHYNLYCPADPQAADGYDGHVPVGCVATAYAQIMKFHAWPAWGRGSCSYYDDGLISGWHDVDVSDPFDWWDMQSSYSPFSEEPENAVHAIAELMYELGVAAQTNYESGGSSADPHTLARVLPDHFRYESVSFLDEEDAPDFQATLRQDLLKQRPCLASFSGHTFVIDGVMSQGNDTFFHCNLGWGGSDNGWYLLSDVQSLPVVQIGTHIQPALTALHWDAVPTPQGLELQWLLPETRIEEITRINLLKRRSVTGTFRDNADNFNTFAITSTSNEGDWVISPEGADGSCFYKEGSGLTNRAYHLTSNRSFRPNSSSALTFQVKSVLTDLEKVMVQVSTDNGISFSTIHTLASGIHTSWQDQRISLSTYANRDILVRFEYGLGTSYYTDGGVWIDSVEIQSTTWYEWDPIQNINELTAYREERSSLFEDPAENFTAFALSSDHHNRDWVLSPEGASGSCFFKAASFDADPSRLSAKAAYVIEPGTQLTFQAKYILAEDIGRVTVSTDQGVSFTPLWSQTDTYRDNWVAIQIPLDIYAGQNILIRFEYLPGRQAYTQGGGLWIDNIHLETVTGRKYSKHPIYYASAPSLTTGEHSLCYQIMASDQAQARSDTFTIALGQ
jgi:hypothetical protein